MRRRPRLASRAIPLEPDGPKLTKMPVPENAATLIASKTVADAIKSTTSQRPLFFRRSSDKWFTLLRPVEVQPVTVETGRTNVESDANEAYSQLMSMAEELAASGKYQSVASAFAALFSDQKNAELAARAHKRPNAAHA
jgi:hypothetical protein